jgi:mRNA-degrading endonuclease RelE of RelBE toxin-antitoxin system
MKSTTSDRFWKCYNELPAEVRKQAKDSYSFFLKNPYHPSLHFKRIHSTRPIYSVRVSYDYRAIGIVDSDEITWFWIGPHAEYDGIIKRLRKA